MQLPALALLIALCAPSLASATGTSPDHAEAASSAPASTFASKSADEPLVESADSPLRLRQPELRRGWGKAAGNLGIGLGLGLAGVTLGTALFGQRYFLASIGGPGVGAVLALGTMVTTAVMVPLVAIGSSSSRCAAGVDGSLAARVAGWIAYGLGLAGPLLVAVAEGPETVAISLAMVGTVSLILHGVDARLAGRHAEEKIGAVALAPYLAPAFLADGRAAPTVGVGGRF